MASSANANLDVVAPTEESVRLLEDSVLAVFFLRIQRRLERGEPVDASDRESADEYAKALWQRRRSHAAAVTPVQPAAAAHPAPAPTIESPKENDGIDSLAATPNAARRFRRQVDSDEEMEPISVDMVDEPTSPRGRTRASAAHGAPVPEAKSRSVSASKRAIPEPPKTAPRPSKPETNTKTERRRESAPPQTKRLEVVVPTETISTRSAYKKLQEPPAAGLRSHSAVKSEPSTKHAASGTNSASSSKKSQAPAASAAPATKKKEESPAPAQPSAASEDHKDKPSAKVTNKSGDCYYCHVKHSVQWRRYDDQTSCNACFYRLTRKAAKEAAQAAAEVHAVVASEAESKEQEKTKTPPPAPRSSKRQRSPSPSSATKEQQPAPPTRAARGAADIRDPLDSLLSKVDKKSLPAEDEAQAADESSEMQVDEQTMFLGFTPVAKAGEASSRASPALATPALSVEPKLETAANDVSAAETLAGNTPIETARGSPDPAKPAERTSRRRRTPSPALSTHLIPDDEPQLAEHVELDSEDVEALNALEELEREIEEGTKKRRMDESADRDIESWST